MSDHDTQTGNDSRYNVTYQITNVVADEDQCRISYHWKSTRGQASLPEADLWFSLRNVQYVQSKPYEQFQTEVDARAGDPNTVTSSTNPPLTVLMVHQSRNIKEQPFILDDPQLADRVARALTHAVELCGGGNNEPF